MRELTGIRLTGLRGAYWSAQVMLFGAIANLAWAFPRKDTFSGRAYDVFSWANCHRYWAYEKLEGRA